MQIIPESHTHDLNEQQLGYLVEKFADRTAFFIETVILPPELGRVKCALVGPTVGDAPIEDHEVFFAKRGDRQYDSRMISPSKVVTHMVREVTVIAGPRDGKPCVLYAAYGGPLAPKEPADPTLEASKLDESKKFWSEHALIAEK